MRFENAVETDFEDVGSGHVLFSAPGHPGFPARLALELFDRARTMTGRERVTVWDPLCGAGSLVTTVTLLRRSMIAGVIASDIDHDALGLARRNIALTQPGALELRAQDLDRGGAHPSRSRSARRLAEALAEAPLPVLTGRADATDADSLRALDALGASPPSIADADVVLADLPYGTQTEWSSAATSPVDGILSALADVLRPHAAVVLVANDRAAFRGITGSSRTFKHGRRVIKFFRPADEHRSTDRETD